MFMHGNQYIIIHMVLDMTHGVDRNKHFILLGQRFGRGSYRREVSLGNIRQLNHIVTGGGALL